MSVVSCPVGNLVRVLLVTREWEFTCPTCGMNLVRSDTHSVPGSRRRVPFAARFPRHQGDAAEQDLGNSVAEPWLHCDAGHGYMRYVLPGGVVMRLMARVRSRVKMIAVDDLLMPLALSAPKLDQVKRVLQAQVQRGDTANEPQALLSATLKLLGLPFAGS